MLSLLCPMMYLKATSWKRIDWRRNKSEFVLLPLPNAEWNKEGGHDRSSYFGTNPAHFISIIFFNRLPFIFLIECPSSFHGQQKGTSPTMPTANVAKKGTGEFHQFLYDSSPIDCCPHFCDISMKFFPPYLWYIQSPSVLPLQTKERKLWLTILFHFLTHLFIFSLFLIRLLLNNGMN